MKNTIGILDYGTIGNIYNIKKLLTSIEVEFIIITQKSDFEKIDKLILPGVGTFDDAMEELNKNNLIDILIQTINSKPTLGICLGMQILASLGFENKETKGLNIIDGEVTKLETNGVIPHLGFNSILSTKKNPLFNGIENDEFYFMHSFILNNTSYTSATSTYLDYEFISAIQKNNIFGVQFHPEKSRDAGIRLIKNFVELSR